MTQTIFKPNHIGFRFVDGFVPKYEATIAGKYYFWYECADHWKLYLRDDKGLVNLFFTVQKYTVYNMDAGTIIHKIKEAIYRMGFQDVLDYAEWSYRQYKIDQLLKPD